MRFAGLPLVAVLLLTEISRAECPRPGDLAPGALNSGWTITGDDRVSVADAVVLAHVRDGSWTLHHHASCPHADDIAPGVSHAGTWSPAGNATIDDCDLAVARDLVLGRLASAFDPTLDAAVVGGAAVLELRSAEMPPLTDAASEEGFLEDVTAQLESVDAATLGPELLEAWIEGNVAGTCDIAVPPPPQGIVQAQGGAAYWLARIRATRAWTVLVALVESAAYEPGGELRARNDGLFLVIAAVVVKVETLDAFHHGTIDQAGKDGVLTLAVTNPFEAWRQLMQLLSRPVPPWLEPAPGGCLRGCEPELCLGGDDEDVDGLADCADEDCFGVNECLGNAAPGIDDPYTVALLHGDGDDGMPAARDESGKLWDGIGAGWPVNDTTTAMFRPGSFRFDGTRGATALAEPDFNFGTGDFTIDWWARVNPGGSGAREGHRRMICLGSTTFSLQVATEWSNASGRVGLWAGNGSQWLVLEQVGTTNVFSAWHHFALVRSGDTLTVFVDGQPEIVAPMPAGWVVAGEPRVTLGHMYNSSDGYLMDGWMDEVRVSKGIARWTAAFTPPAHRYESMAKGGDRPQTTVLIHGDGNDGIATILDETGRGWQQAGGAVVNSHAQAKFGAGSLRFERGMYLTTTAATDFDFGTGDFTLEAWIWFDSIEGNFDIIFGRGVSDPGRFLLYRWSDYLIFYDGATIGNVGERGLTAQAWHHCAVTRHEDLFRVFIDGRQVNASYSTGPTLDAGEPFMIGQQPVYPYGFSGYMDEIRIIKGVAAWSADFTPPDAPYASP